MIDEDEKVLLALSRINIDSGTFALGVLETVFLGMIRSPSVIDLSIWQKLSGSERFGQLDSS